MDEILQKLSTPAIIAAIEANLAEEMATFGRYFPGAELHEGEEVRWFSTGLAGYLLEVAILQAFLVIPTVAYYLSLWPSRNTAVNRVCAVHVCLMALPRLRDDHPGGSDREAPCPPWF